MHKVGVLFKMKVLIVILVAITTKYLGQCQLTLNSDLSRRFMGPTTYYGIQSARRQEDNIPEATETDHSQNTSEHADLVSRYMTARLNWETLTTIVRHDHTLLPVALPFFFGLIPPKLWSFTMFNNSFIKRRPKRSSLTVAVSRDDVLEPRYDLVSPQLVYFPLKFHENLTADHLMHLLPNLERTEENFTIEAGAHDPPDVKVVRELTVIGFHWGPKLVRYGRYRTFEHVKLWKMQENDRFYQSYVTWLGKLSDSIGQHLGMLSMPKFERDAVFYVVEKPKKIKFKNVIVIWDEKLDLPKAGHAVTFKTTKHVKKLLKKKKVKRSTDNPRFSDVFLAGGNRNTLAEVFFKTSPQVKIFSLELPVTTLPRPFRSFQYVPIFVPMPIASYNPNSVPGTPFSLMPHIPSEVQPLEDLLYHDPLFVHRHPQIVSLMIKHANYSNRSNYTLEIPFTTLDRNALINETALSSGASSRSKRSSAKNPIFESVFGNKNQFSTLQERFFAPSHAKLFQVEEKLAGSSMPESLDAPTLPIAARLVLPLLREGRIFRETKSFIPVYEINDESYIPRASTRNATAPSLKRIFYEGPFILPQKTVLQDVNPKVYSAQPHRPIGSVRQLQLHNAFSLPKDHASQPFKEFSNKSSVTQNFPLSSLISLPKVYASKPFQVTNSVPFSRSTVRKTSVRRRLKRSLFTGGNRIFASVFDSSRQSESLQQRFFGSTGTWQKNFLTDSNEFPKKYVAIPEKFLKPNECKNSSSEQEQGFPVTKFRLPKSAVPKHFEPAKTTSQFALSKPQFSSQPSAIEYGSGPLYGYLNMPFTEKTYKFSSFNGLPQQPTSSRPYLRWNATPTASTLWNLHSVLESIPSLSNRSSLGHHQPSRDFADQVNTKEPSWSYEYAIPHFSNINTPLVAKSKSQSSILSGNKLQVQKPNTVENSSASVFDVTNHGNVNLKPSSNSRYSVSSSSRNKQVSANNVSSLMQTIGASPSSSSWNFQPSSDSTPPAIVTRTHIVHQPLEVINSNSLALKLPKPHGGVSSFWADTNSSITAPTQQNVQYALPHLPNDPLTNRKPTFDSQLDLSENSRDSTLNVPQPISALNTSRPFEANVASKPSWNYHYVLESTRVGTKLNEPPVNAASLESVTPPKILLISQQQPSSLRLPKVGMQNSFGTTENFSYKSSPSQQTSSESTIVNPLPSKASPFHNFQTTHTEREKNGTELKVPKPNVYREFNSNLKTFRKELVTTPPSVKYSVVAAPSIKPSTVDSPKQIHLTTPSLSLPKLSQTSFPPFSTKTLQVNTPNLLQVSLPQPQRTTQFSSSELSSKVTFSERLGNSRESSALHPRISLSLPQALQQNILFTNQFIPSGLRLPKVGVRNSLRTTENSSGESSPSHQTSSVSTIVDPLPSEAPRLHTFQPKVTEGEQYASELIVPKTNGYRQFHSNLKTSSKKIVTTTPPVKYSVEVAPSIKPSHVDSPKQIYLTTPLGLPKISQTNFRGKTQRATQVSSSEISSKVLVTSSEPLGNSTNSSALHPQISSSNLPLALQQNIMFTNQFILPPAQSPASAQISHVSSVTISSILSNSEVETATSNDHLRELSVPSDLKHSTFYDSKKGVLFASSNVNVKSEKLLTEAPKKSNLVAATLKNTTMTRRLPNVPKSASFNSQSNRLRNFKNFVTTSPVSENTNAKFHRRMPKVVNINESSSLHHEASLTDLTKAIRENHQQSIVIVTEKPKINNLVLQTLRNNATFTRRLPNGTKKVVFSHEPNSVSGKKEIVDVKISEAKNQTFPLVPAHPHSLTKTRVAKSRPGKSNLVITRLRNPGLTKSSVSPPLLNNVPKPPTNKTLSVVTAHPGPSNTTTTFFRKRPNLTKGHTFRPNSNKTNLVVDHLRNGTSKFTPTTPVIKPSSHQDGATSNGLNAADRTNTGNSNRNRMGSDDNPQGVVSTNTKSRFFINRDKTQAIYRRNISSTTESNILRPSVKLIESERSDIPVEEGAESESFGAGQPQHDQTIIATVPTNTNFSDVSSYSSQSSTEGSEARASTSVASSAKSQNSRKNIVVFSLKKNKVVPSVTAQ